MTLIPFAVELKTKKLLDNDAQMKALAGSLLGKDLKLTALVDETDPWNPFPNMLSRNLDLVLICLLNPLTSPGKKNTNETRDSSSVLRIDCTGADINVSLLVVSPGTIITAQHRTNRKNTST